MKDPTNSHTMFELSKNDNVLIYLVEM